jgi:hypothetical protein
LACLESCELLTEFCEGIAPILNGAKHHERARHSPLVLVSDKKTMRRIRFPAWQNPVLAMPEKDLAKNTMRAYRGERAEG